MYYTSRLPIHATALHCLYLTGTTEFNSNGARRVIICEFSGAVY